MKKFNLIGVVLKPVFSTTNGKQKQNIDFIIDDKSSVWNLICQLTALLMTLPLITVLLLLWFNLK